MTIDKFTKMIFAAIAVALWIIALNPWLRPMHVAAQGNRDLSLVESYLSDIKSDVSDVNDNVSSMKGDLGRLQRGTCTNGKIC